MSRRGVRREGLSLLYLFLGGSWGRKSKICATCYTRGPGDLNVLGRVLSQIKPY